VKLTSNADAIAARVAGWSQAIGPELAKATLECATTLVAAAKREAPVKSGRLRRSITYQVGGEARYIVSPNVPYATAVHEGITDPVIIRPTTKKALFWKGALHPVKSVKQKARKGNPFMRRALDTSRAQLDAIAARAGARIVTRQG